MFYKMLMTQEKDAVITALKESIARKKQIAIVELFGKINFDTNYEYKKARTRGDLLYVGKNGNIL